MKSSQALNLSAKVLLSLTLLSVCALLLPAQSKDKKSTPRPTDPQTVASAPAASGWTVVLARDWRTRAPGLVGNRVELSGNLSTQLIVNPRSSFSNVGWMKDAGNNKLATVLFDQIGDAELAWMRKSRCSETCAGVFVRGVVVGANRSAPILRMIDVSFESRAGAAPANMVQLDSGHDGTPAVEKQLLPRGGVPTTLGPSAVTQMPVATPDSTAGKSVYERMQDRSLKMRQRDMNLEKGTIPGPERPPDFETNYRSIRDTRLLKVFANYPWNTGRNAWPRVALVVEQEATGGTGALGFLRPGEKIKDRCWQLRARLWSGPAASQEIAPFNWCLSEMRFNVPYNDVALWGMTRATSMAEQNTGLDRTLGPNPPAIHVPRFHYDNGSYSDTIMLGNILLDMSFSFGVPDGRVWVADRPKDSFTGLATGVTSDATTTSVTSERKSGAAQAMDSSTKDTKEEKSAEPSANSYIPAVEIKQDADNLKQTLEGMPYTSEGNGAVIYIFEYSDCPFAQRRYQDWKGKLEGVELRHFFYATNERSANETAALASSRDIKDYYAYMEHRKTAPDRSKTGQSIDAFNSIVSPITNIIVPILHRNGWTIRNLVSPNYFWEMDGKWYSDGGYKEHGSFESIMNMVVLNKAAQHNPRTPDTGHSVNTQPAVSNTVSDVSAIAASTRNEKQLDILGIKLGVSTPLEVKAAIARQSRAFTVEESPAKLAGYLRTGRIAPAPVDVPNGKYVASIKAVVSSSKPVSCGDIASQVDCERIEVWFAAPPNAPTARIVRRVINYIHGPTVENVERSVIEKYGEPGFRQNADSINPMNYPARYVWAWSADGKPFAFPPRQDLSHSPHPCAASPDQGRIVGSSFGEQNYFTPLLNAGCAVVLYLNVVSKNDVVSTMRYFAVDESGIVTSNTKTATFVSDYIAAVEKKEAEDAAKVKVNP